MPVDGRPDVVTAAADAMTRAAEQIDGVRRDVGDPVRAMVAGWRGEPAQVATARLDQDLDVLARAADACRRVAPALQAYAEYLRRAQADAAEGQRIMAGADTVLGAGVVEIGAQQRARADLEMGANIVRSAEGGVTAAAEDAARIIREEAALLPDPVDVERGTLLDGLAKAGGDLLDEAGSTLAGAFDHVNVFSDRFGETWSRTGATVAAAVTDPMGAVGTVVDGATAPIGDSYRAGGVDEAAGRTVGAIASALVGKGATKLNKIAPEGPQDAPLEQPYPQTNLVPGGGLQRHEELGGHTLNTDKAHVEATDEDLLDRLRREPHIPSASTYTDRETAENAISENLNANRAAVDRWLNDADDTTPGRFKLDHGHVIGRSVERGGTVDDVAESSLSRVVLKKDPDTPLGYYILTSFPDG